ncbi:MAG: tetratricopeptide repeat protein [Candidatus Omnitrophica bacterium]|nr:tetratricopeptide repeat protein [Candidatus Omnitrophota bacterium]MDD5671430.1 tetratricopeptide repeat protein [Candidatus Omnitrophota bacterium]
MKSRIVLCFLFSLSFSGLGIAGGPGESAFNEGLRQHDQGMLAEAEKHLIDAIALEPTNADYHFELANIYAAAYDQWKRDPKRSQTEEYLGRAAYELQQAIMFRPDFLAAHFNLGVVYKKRGQYEKAREQFKKVLKQNPDSSPAWMQIGATYEEQGFDDDARDAYLEAKQRDYTNTDIQTALDDLEMHQSEPEQTRGGGLGAGDPFGMFDQGAQYSLYQQQSAQGYQQQQPAQGSMQQALPAVAAMLVQQFMNRRAGNSLPSNSDEE